MTAELDAGAAFVGALLHLPATRCAAPLARVDSGMLEDAAVSSVLELVRSVVAEGFDPDPHVVSDFALSTGAISVSRWPQLSDVILRCYTSVPSPAMVDYYAQALINQAARHALRREAERLVQVAESSSLADAFAQWSRSAEKIASASAAVRGVS